MSRKLIISIGGPENLAEITRSINATWAQFVAFLSRTPMSATNKAAAGWYCPAEFSINNRHGENLVARHALTFDYDKITPDDLRNLQIAYRAFDYLMYTTASHTKQAPRVRVVFPLSRPVSALEFACVTRTVGNAFDLNKLAQESDKPAQMMFLPTKKPKGDFWVARNDGIWVDVDSILGAYDDWRDKTSWPKRTGESLHNHDGEIPDPPNTKPGVVGDFCRAFRVPEAIVAFELPYSPGSTEDRYTYDQGSRPDGLRIYDDGLKAHSEHDTDPAHGQTNAFDLVRLHKFGELDTEADRAKPITERPSYRAMVQLAMEQPEVQAEAAAEWTNLDAEPAKEAEPRKPLATRFSELKSTKPRWLLRDKLERGVIALMAGPRGSYKSFIALDWVFTIANTLNQPVYVLSAEGIDFDRRGKAWLRTFAPEWTADNVYVAQMRMDLTQKANIELIRDDCTKTYGIRPVLFLLDTFSKLSGALDENSNTDVKAFIGLLDNGLKRAFDATVLLVTHTGHGEKTRARGASALEADTDAAYVVSRHDAAGMVQLTRERFKSSPELPPLVLQPETIQLGYMDDDGVPVSSVIMRPSTKVAMLGGSSEVRGQWPVHLMTVAQEELRQGPMAPDKLTEIAASKVPPPEGRDTRRQVISRALQKLVSEGHLHQQTNGWISLTTAVSADEEWTDG